MCNFTGTIVECNNVKYFDVVTYNNSIPLTIRLYYNVLNDTIIVKPLCDLEEIKKFDIQCLKQR